MTAAQVRIIGRDKATGVEWTVRGEMEASRARELVAEWNTQPGAKSTYRTEPIEVRG